MEITLGQEKMQLEKLLARKSMYWFEEVLSRLENTSGSIVYLTVTRTRISGECMRSLQGLAMAAGC